MTECERLIANGTFSPDFFKPELRCDFLVDENRKKLWAVEIDLLLQFEKMCAKYDLRYFLSGGTLLGAVRHNGFVPWDDDIDVWMLRSDYERFLTHSNEFEQPYVLEYPGCNNDYLYSYAKLKNENTTFLSPVFQYQKFCHGIFLDVFPLDDTFEGEDSTRYDRIKALCIDNSTCMRMTNPNLSAADIERVQLYSGLSPSENLREINRLCTMHLNDPAAKCLADLACPIYSWEKVQYKRESFSDVVLHEFENFEFPMPRGWQDVLTANFGDWHQFPPVEDRGAWHGDMLYDPDTPYRSYIDRVVRCVK